MTGRKQQRRIIADYSMGKPGALVIAIGAMHGNETAGVRAIRHVHKLLKLEPKVNPGFQFQGRFVGLIGNVQAYQQKKRYLEHDLNRMWVKEHLARAEREGAFAEGEWKELYELNQLLSDLIDRHDGDVLLLDLHTTSAEGGIFTIALDGPDASERVARSLQAPVVKGLLTGISGTLLHHVQALREQSREITCVAFESGSHHDPLSVDRAVAALILALRSMATVRPEDVDPRHSKILIEYGKHLPRVVTLVHVHKIKPADGFVMRPGYINFQKIALGEHVADDRHGPICAPHTGRILMPLYQKQGSDGFFIVVDG